MHAAAKVLATEHGGTFPRTVAALRGLPGIGRYTAGAIASIAMDLPEPIVEANSRRVLARLAGYTKRLDRPGGDEPIWEIAHSLVPQRDAGRFNQALMDLGAMVCTPDRPLCTACPLARMCDAKNSGRVSRIPMKSVRRATKQLREAAIIVRRGARVLVQKREEGEWWAGLWDFPRQATSQALAPLGCGKPRRLGSITHTVTHHKITLEIVECAAARAGRTAANRAWVPLAKLATLAMTAPGRRIAGMLEQTSR
jgi:A/G-specific adenine glycosylase